MEGPDELKNIKNFPESEIIKVEEVVAMAKVTGETAMLPNDQSN